MAVGDEICRITFDGIESMWDAEVRPVEIRTETIKELPKKRRTQSSIVSSILCIVAVKRFIIFRV